MKKLCCALLAAATLALCGCGSFLERTYSSSQPHSATYYESEDRSVLRAEGYQDLVNDILLLVGENAKEGTIWLYNTSDSDTQDAGEAARRACAGGIKIAFGIQFFRQCSVISHIAVHFANHFGRSTLLRTKDGTAPVFAAQRVCDVARCADDAVFERRQGIFVLDFREHAQPLCAERDGVAVFI